MNEKMRTLETVNELLTNLGVTVTLKQVWKNNGPIEGIELHTAGNLAAPVIYTDEQWWMRSAEEIADELEDIYLSNSINVDAQRLSDLTSREYVLAHVIPQIVSAKNVQEMADRDIAYLPYIDDLVAIFAAEIDDLEGGRIRITNTLLKERGISLDALYQQALKNCAGRYKIVSMAEMLKEMLGMEADEMIPGDGDNVPLYVLTNKEKLFGAAALLDPDILLSIHEKLGSDYYVLPSSVHEVLVMPKSEFGQTPDELLSMVTEINATQVEPEDRLSDNVYQYTLEGGIKALF